VCAGERANEGNPLIQYFERQFTYIRRNSSVFRFALPERFINGQGLEMFMDMLIVIEGPWIDRLTGPGGYGILNERGLILAGGVQWKS